MGNLAILGLIDVVSPSGLVEGWATYVESSAVCHVQIRLDGAVVAEDMADKFRPDLLRAGIGHGHCAFYAPMKSVPPGKYNLCLHDGRTGTLIAESGTALHEVPARDPLGRKSIRSVLRVRERWNDDDVRSCVDRLQLQRNCDSMGIARYVDRVFRFVLGRWADEAGARHYADAIERGQMTPDEVFLAVLNSSERHAQNRVLPHPTDPDYPFVVYDYAAALEPVRNDWRPEETPQGKVLLF